MSLLLGQLARKVLGPCPWTSSSHLQLPDTACLRLPNLLCSPSCPAVGRLPALWYTQGTLFALQCPCGASVLPGGLPQTPGLTAPPAWAVIMRRFQSCLLPSYPQCPAQDPTQKSQLNRSLSNEQEFGAKGVVMGSWAPQEWWPGREAQHPVWAGG